MLDLASLIWTDQRGIKYELFMLEQNHLLNIKKMLEGIISGKRERPEGCMQSLLELRSSLRYINSEIAKRENKIFSSTSKFTESKSNKVSVSQVWTISPCAYGDTAKDLIEALQTLPANAKFSGIAMGNLVFKSN